MRVVRVDSLQEKGYEKRRKSVQCDEKMCLAYVKGDDNIFFQICAAGGLW